MLIQKLKFKTSAGLQMYLAAVCSLEISHQSDEHNNLTIRLVSVDDLAKHFGGEVLLTQKEEIKT